MDSYFTLLKYSHLYLHLSSHDANGASFTGLDVAADHNLVVYHGGTVWFTVIAQSSDDDLEG